MADEFLPEGYKENESLNERVGGYMKFAQGANKFRILSSAITGWEWWEEREGKRFPKRVRINEKINISELEDPDSLKRFWAMVVYNYDLKQIQILEVTQKGIQKTLKDLAQNEEWGTPKGYDIVVVREGEGMETSYNTIPSPPKELSKEIMDAFAKTSINLEALYKGDDPFSKEVELTDEQIDEALKM